MSYDPSAPTAQERAGSYVVVWIAAIASLGMLALRLLDISGHPWGLACMLFGLPMLAILHDKRHDDYFRSLRDFGLRFAMAVVSLWVGVQGLLFVLGAARSAGYATAGGPAAAASRFALPPLFDDAGLLASLAAVGFSTGFLFAYWRGAR